jgi:molecular chaperone DnaK (HSP70)
VVGTDPNTKRKRNAILIPRNTPLPVKAERVFKTQRANQDSVLVRIVEGESPAPDSCTQLGRCVIRDVPAQLPAGSPVKVRFEYGADGRLTVSVKVAGTEQRITQEITRDNSLSKEDREQWRAKIAARPN